MPVGGSVNNTTGLKTGAQFKFITMPYAICYMSDVPAPSNFNYAEFDV